MDENTEKVNWKDRDWIREKDLSKWKLPFKFIGRMVISLVCFIAAFAPLIATIIYFEDVNSPGFTYDFFGWFIEVKMIIVYVTLIISIVGIYGFIKCTQMWVKFFAKKAFKLTWKPKAITVYILIVVIIAVNYYSPFWYMSLGILPSFGPYIAVHGDYGMQISWDTGSEDETYILWGNSASNVSTKAVGGEFWYENNTKETIHHCVALKSLQPDTDYWYTVPSLGKEIYKFHTAPTPDSKKAIRFTILGDTQGNLAVQRANMHLMTLTSNPDFTIIAGDTCNQDDDIPEFAMLMDGNSYGKISATVPWMAASGNHETSSENDDHPIRYNFKRRFQNVYTTPDLKPITDARDVGCYYSFNYSNVHMVIMDCLEMTTGNFSQTQMDWLVADLSRNQGNWKFLTFHYSMYSDSDHGSYPDLAKQLEPIFESHNVDALFYGHDHIFEAYQVNYTTQQDGTMAFMVAGGGGGLKQVTNPEKMGSRTWETTWVNSYGNVVLIGNETQTDGRFNDTKSYGFEHQLYAERCHHYMDVNVNGDTCEYSAYRTTDGSLIKTYSRSRKI
jgi:predicted phosphodiesterase